MGGKESGKLSAARQLQSSSGLSSALRETGSSFSEMVPQSKGRYFLFGVARPC